MTPFFDEVRFGAGSFVEKIAKIRASASVDFPWYPYATMSNLEPIASLMSGKNDYLFKKPKMIADIGGADGDLALYLSELHYDCDLYDYGPTNMNGLRGAQYLKSALGSTGDLRVGSRFTILSPGKELRSDVFHGLTLSFEKSILCLGTDGEALPPHVYLDQNCATFQSRNAGRLRHLGSLSFGPG